MAIQNIGTNTDWNQASSRINSNFQSLAIDVEKTKNASIRSKGWFSTLELLKQAYPNPQNGDWAVVNNIVYECKTKGEWKSTGLEWNGGEVPLSEYVAKSELTEELGNSTELAMSQKGVSDAVSKIGTGNVFDWYNTESGYQRNKELLTTCILDLYSTNLILSDSKYFSYPLYMASYGKQSSNSRLIFQLYFYDEDLGDFPWKDLATFYIYKDEYEQAIVDSKCIEKIVYPAKSGSVTIKIKPIVAFDDWNDQIGNQHLAINNGNFYRNVNLESGYALRTSRYLNLDNVMSKAFLRAIDAPQIKGIRFYEKVTTDGIFNRITVTLNKLENLQVLKYKIYIGNKSTADMLVKELALNKVQEGRLSDGNVKWNDNIGDNVSIDMLSGITTHINDYVVLEVFSEDETPLNPLCYFNSMSDTVKGAIPPEGTHTFYIHQITNDTWVEVANRQNLWFIQPTLVIENYKIENDYFVESSVDFIKELFLAFQFSDEAKQQYVEDRKNGYVWTIGEVRSTGIFVVYAYNYLYKTGDGSNAGYYQRYVFVATPNTGIQVLESDGNYALVNTDKFPSTNIFTITPFQAGITPKGFQKNTSQEIDYYILDNKPVKEDFYTEEDLKLLLPDKIFTVKGVELQVYKDSISRVLPTIKTSIFSVPIPTDALNVDSDIDKPQIDYNMVKINKLKGCSKIRFGYIDNLDIKNRIIYKDCEVQYNDAPQGKSGTALIIGDSLTNRGVAAFTVKAVENIGSTLTTFGTMTNNFETKSEGREGWKWSDYIGRSTTVAGKRIQPMGTGTNGTLYENPFVRLATEQDYQEHPEHCYRNTGVSNELSYQNDSDKTGNFYIFDFDYYLKRWGEEKPNIPDVISIALGTNDVLRENVDNIIQNAIFMVQRIQEVLPSVKIALIPSPAWGINTVESTYNKVIQYITAITDAFKSIENVEIIGMWAFMSRILSFGIKEKQEIDQSTFKAIYADFVHFDLGTEGDGHRAYIEYSNVLASWILNKL